MLLRKIFFCITILYASACGAQTAAPVTGDSVTMPASDRHHKNALYKRLWGEHYRKEWHTPARFPVACLDTLKGGLTPYELGGGRQTKSIRLRDKNKHEYVLRSIDKRFGPALPPIARNTFIEDLADDQVTIAHPYASLIVPPLAEAAGIYHTNPKVYYIPKQPALGKFNDSVGDALYMLEQRPDEDWSNAANFGNSKNIVGTEKMFEKTLEDNDDIVDQQAFLRARLFDMYIGDWGRHDDQWRWATFKDGKRTTYVPIPRDRDNAFSVFDGLLLKPLIRAANAKHLQTFEARIRNVKTFNFPARNLDRRYLNATTLQDWQRTAAALQAAMTDSVIDVAVRQLPPEVYAISGPMIAAKLKERRSQMPESAEEYFYFINHEVEVPGTEDNELFEVLRNSDSTTQVKIYKITNKGKLKEAPFYSRTFYHDETREVRLYGIDGNDSFKVSGNVKKSVKLRLIGGPKSDVYTDNSSITKNARRTLIYDDYGNDISGGRETKLHLSHDKNVHAYQYDIFKPNRKSGKPISFYNLEDRIHVGVGLTYEKQRWRKVPFGIQHKFNVKYSIEQRAFSATYSSYFPMLLKKWDVFTYLNYDFIRWTKFFGLGNESVMTTDNRDFNRVRSRQSMVRAGVQRVFGNRHKIVFNPFYQTYDVINDTARFLAKTNPNVFPENFHTQQYLGAELIYVYQKLNDSSMPVKGISLLLGSSYTQNIGQGSKYLGRYLSEATVYLPLFAKFGLKLRAGGATLSGQPAFYQYNRIASSGTIRGYQRDRFYGKSSFYNQNELRWITDVRSHLFNGKFGLFGLYDMGRVWLPGENSDALHTSYGGGFVISLFNRLSAEVAYAKSADDANLHISLIKVL